MNNLYFGIMLAFALGGSFLIGERYGQKKALEAVSNLMKKEADKINGILKGAMKNVSNETEENKENSEDPGRLN